MINKVGKITIFVNDKNSAKQFWMKKMNFVIKLEEEIAPGMTWLEIAPSVDEFTTLVLCEKDMMLSQNPNANIVHPSVILSTTNAKSTHEELSKNGVVVGELIQNDSMFTFKDQDGNEFLVREDN